MDAIQSDKKGNILIVDDEAVNLTVLRHMLTEHGFNVHPALSGEVALKAVQIAQPDLILLDILMPGMDGYTVCRKLKMEERLKDIPIILDVGCGRVSRSGLFH